MKRNRLFAALLPALALPLLTTAQETGEVVQPRVLQADEVVVRSSSKETNNLYRVPGASSLITPFQIATRKIESIKELSITVPNLFIPDYGSKMTAPVYLRGVGARSSGQGIGMYVDNVPYMDKSTFDFELMDIQRIEVLRGPQGTLYGRNAMGGIINVYTLSPLDYQGNKIQIGGGNYGYWNAKASKYAKLGENIGLSVGGYWDKEGGYFTNAYNNEKVDDGQSAGGRIKLEWRINPRLKAILSSNYDYTDQGAFPYGLYDETTDEVDPVNYNDRGSYLRNMSNNALRFEFQTSKVLLTSNTGYQWLQDNMWMDQDFTPQSIFTIHQKQQKNSLSQEFNLRSVTRRNYQWSVGAFGFYDYLKTSGDVLFKQDGITTVLQPVFDNMMPPTVPVRLTITDTEIPNPGLYKTPSAGAAIFHQSTFNNLLTDGLSLTLGLRLDYEKQWLDYNAGMAMHVNATMNRGPVLPAIVIPYTIEKNLIGNEDQDFLQWLPKISLKYECTPQIMTYATVSKGYKAGGYNIQMFSEVIQDSLKTWRPTGMPAAAASSDNDINNALSYKPEVVWNYEVGARGSFFDGVLTGELALFYMDIQDVQLTQFVNGGSGRILTNAGRAESYGAEVSLGLRPHVKGLSFDVNYGYTHATFRDYNAGVDNSGNVLDYKGNFIPYVPQHTLSAAGNYSLNLRGWLEQLTFSAQYQAAGKIYWTEANDLTQPFYGQLNARVSLRHDFAQLELWGRNLTNTDYGAFYFESFGKSFVQKGRPLTIGANLIFNF